MKNIKTAIALKNRKEEQLKRAKNEEQFLGFLNRGEPPFDYERKLFKTQFKRLLSIYDGNIIPPYEVEIQPSSVCNLNCTWCVGDNEKYPKLENLLSKESMIKISNDIIEFVEDGFCIETVKFSGFVGEPLVNPATIDGLDIFIKNGKRVGLFTNGMLIDRKIADGRRYIDTICRASYLHLSLDAGSPHTMQKLKGLNADFEKIIHNLEMVIREREQQKTKLEVGVGYITIPENYLEVYELSKRLKDIGVDFIRFKVDITGKYLLGDTAKRVGEEIDRAKELIGDGFNVVSIHGKDESKCCEIYDVHKMNGIKCYAAKLWGTVGSDGNLYACDHRTHKNGKLYGDLKTNKFKDVWMSRNYNLPDNYCAMCSPFGTRTNRFLSFLFGLDRDQIVELHEKYFVDNR